MPRRLKRPVKTVALTKAEKRTQQAVYAEFKRQGSATNSYLTSKGIHQRLYSDAQRQRAEHLYKGIEKAKDDIKPPLGMLNQALRDWKRRVAKDRMAKTLQKRNVEAGKVGGQIAMLKMGVEVSFNLKNKKLINALKKRGTKIAGVVNDNTLKRFQKLLVSRYYYHGEDPREVKRAIKGLFEETYKNRAWTIARTETGAAQMEVQVETFKKNDIKRKYWMAIIDDRTRETHVSCTTEGDIPMDERFESNGMLYPYDGSAPADEIINCRCDLGIVTVTREEGEDVWAGEDD